MEQKHARQGLFAFDMRIRMFTCLWIVCITQMCGSKAYFGCQIQALTNN